MEIERELASVVRAQGCGWGSHFRFSGMAVTGRGQEHQVPGPLSTLTSGALGLCRWAGLWLESQGHRAGRQRSPSGSPHTCPPPHPPPLLEPDPLTLETGREGVIVRVSDSPVTPHLRQGQHTPRWGQHSQYRLRAPSSCAFCGPS